MDSVCSLPDWVPGKKHDFAHKVLNYEKLRGWLIPNTSADGKLLVLC